MIKFKYYFNHHFQLNFTDFDIEHAWSCQYDNVTIRNGPWWNSPLMATFCGTKELPENKDKNWQIDSQVTVEFKLNLLITGDTILKYSQAIKYCS